MKPKYGKDLWLCYIDTDSLVYDIKTDDFYEDIVVTQVVAATVILVQWGKQEGHWPDEGRTGQKDHDRVHGT